MSAYIEVRKNLRERILKLNRSEALYEEEFMSLSLESFRFQYLHNTFYRKYCNLLECTINSVFTIDQIPFLPIEFFKSEEIKTGEWKEERVFSSSGTTGSTRSRHLVRDIDYYLENCKRGFEEFHGQVEKFCFLAVLPGYQGRVDSSLITMVDYFIRQSTNKDSAYYLDREEDLQRVLEYNQEHRIPTVLFGVSFALLNLSQIRVSFPELVIIETGGMKNSKVDFSKEEILTKLKMAWKLKRIQSEYGMTELLSQSYSKDGKWYLTASTKKVVIGELTDPFAQQKTMKTGIIKIVDLANLDTCCFIETQDLGISNQEKYFQVLGRMDNAELRGCNLLLDDALKNPIG